jgi:hypothetical protein
MHTYLSSVQNQFQCIYTNNFQADPRPYILARLIAHMHTYLSSAQNQFQYMYTNNFQADLQHTHTANTHAYVYLNSIHKQFQYVCANNLRVDLQHVHISASICPRNCAASLRYRIGSESPSEIQRCLHGIVYYEKTSRVSLECTQAYLHFETGPVCMYMRVSVCVYIYA